MDDITRADMRIEIVKRELNQGALSGMNRQVCDYAAQLVIVALDSFDHWCQAEALRDEYRAGFEAGDKNGYRRGRRER